MRTKFLIHYLFSRITNIIQFSLILHHNPNKDLDKALIAIHLCMISIQVHWKQSPSWAGMSQSGAHSQGNDSSLWQTPKYFRGVWGGQGLCVCVCVGGAMCVHVCEAVLVCCAFFLKNRHCLSHDYIFKGKTTKQLYKSMITKLKFTL